MRKLAWVMSGITAVALLGLSLNAKGHPETMLIGGLILFVFDRALAAILRKHE